MSVLLGIDKDSCECIEQNFRGHDALLKGNYLGEFRTEADRKRARKNLGISESSTPKWGNITGYIENQEDLVKYLKDQGIKTEISQEWGQDENTVVSQKLISDKVGEFENTIEVNSNDIAELKGRVFDISDNVNSKLDKSVIIQTTGQETNKVMSQKAVTDSLKDYITESQVNAKFVDSFPESFDEKALEKASSTKTYSEKILLQLMGILDEELNKLGNTKLDVDNINNNFSVIKNTYYAGDVIFDSTMVEPGSTILVKLKSLRTEGRLYVTGENDKLINQFTIIDSKKNSIHRFDPYALPENYKEVIVGDNNPIEVTIIVAPRGILEINETTRTDRGKAVLIEHTKDVAGETFDQPNTTYIISNDVDLYTLEISVAENCTLKFEGGSIYNGTLVGNNTSIESGNYQIFGDDLKLDGYFTNVANVSWFGAKSYHSRTKDDNTEAINRALAAPFGVVEFNTGLYYVENTLTLPDTKVVKLHGKGGGDLLYTDESYPYNNTCIWTDQNIDVLKIDLNPDDYVRDRHDNVRLIIEGGCFNVSSCSEYNKNVITFICPTWGIFRPEISTSLIGRAYFNGATSLDKDNYLNHGNGVLLTSRDKLLTAGGSKIKGGMYEPNITIDCKGFTNAVVVDHNKDYASITGVHVYGWIWSIVSAVYAKTGGFKFGSVEAVIDCTGGYPDGADLYEYGHIRGIFHDTFIDSVLWDIDRANTGHIALDIQGGSGVILGEKAKTCLDRQHVKNWETLINNHKSNEVPIINDTYFTPNLRGSKCKSQYIKEIDNSLYYMYQNGLVNAYVSATNLTFPEEYSEDIDIFTKGLSYYWEKPDAIDKFVEVTVQFANPVDADMFVLHSCPYLSGESLFSKVHVTLLNGTDVKAEYEGRNDLYEYSYRQSTVHVINNRNIDWSVSGDTRNVNKVVIRYEGFKHGTAVNNTLRFYMMLEGRMNDGYKYPRFIGPEGGTVQNLEVLGDFKINGNSISEITGSSSAVLRYDMSTGYVKISIPDTYSSVFRIAIANSNLERSECYDVIVNKSANKSMVCHIIPVGTTGSEYSAKFKKSPEGTTDQAIYIAMGGALPILLIDSLMEFTGHLAISDFENADFWTIPTTINDFVETPKSQQISELELKLSDLTARIEALENPN